MCDGQTDGRTLHDGIDCAMQSDERVKTIMDFTAVRDDNGDGTAASITEGMGDRSSQI